VNFDTTENLIIEGDNLEVLKLLQGGWHGRVKMIYIDPPYNTGGDFIYPDNYKEGLADYLKFSGQVSGEGVRLTTNPETDGRYHSKWLTMMYPRLFLARNLLREDGVIFVSIDDHEVHNLRAVMNEIFGEENFVANIVWQKRTSPDARLQLGPAHDSILVYCKFIEVFRAISRLLPLSEQRTQDYGNPDNDPRGQWASRDMTGQVGHATPSQFYEITTPSGVKYSPPEGRCWAISKSSVEKMIADNRIWFGKDGASRPRLKLFLSENKGTQSWTWWPNQEVGHNQEATKELNELMGISDVFNNPKPTRLIDRILRLSTAENTNDVILDFFAGSGTTAQAVLELNAQDGGNRKFILVQLPEPTARKDFPTIADITKERARRVIKKLNEADHGKLPMDQIPDRGFKVFKLGGSNFKVWDSTSAPKDAAGLAEQLKLMAHNVEEGRPDEALLYELILKSNLPLTSKITSGKIGKQTFYDVADGTLAICLERKVTQETLRGIMARKPKGVICLDVAFAGNDQLKTNIVLEMKSHGIEFHTA
jgi:adenine-specific DNA-methyltransferase